MPSRARIVRLRHAVLGHACGALDEQGRWLALIPGDDAHDEVTALLARTGFSAADADVATQRAAQAALDRWFATGEAPPAAPPGTDFQKRVWAELLEIPRGETRTYGEIAGRVGCRSARAVGGAVGANPVGLFIPCHRVLAASGLGGFAWGLALKRALLAAEGASLGK